QIAGRAKDGGLVPEHREIRAGRIAHEIVVAFVQQGYVVVEVLVILHRELEGVRALVVIGEVDNGVAAWPGRIEPALENRRERLPPRHAVAERRAAAEHGDPDLPGRLTRGARSAISPHVDAGRSLVLAV